MDKIYRDDVVMTLKHCLPDGVVQDVAVKNVQRISAIETWNKIGTNNLPKDGRAILGAHVKRDNVTYCAGNRIVSNEDGYELINSNTGDHLTINYWMYIPEVDA